MGKAEPCKATEKVFTVAVAGRWAVLRRIAQWAARGVYIKTRRDLLGLT